MRLGAFSTTSTLRPFIARDTRLATRALKRAGSDTALGTSIIKSTSPPLAASLTLDPNKVTRARSPNTRKVVSRIIAIWAKFSLIALLNHTVA